ncbi:MAG: fluoride efflux transporter CrcB [Proteobacteria bacterium]|nr:fluoride efflux transporter CrcB [Pseudomonadota bacterium]MBU1716705.1 fluoride efflux transporter CrcB [Pseudomonadota bacterium]
MLKIMAIMAGGGIGASCRYGLFLLVQRIAGSSFPLGTLAANLLGCFIIGLLWSLFEGTRLSNEWRLFIFTGFLGGFTTFSTFARETAQLLEVNEWKTAAFYFIASNALGIALVFAGYLVSRRLIVSG